MTNNIVTVNVTTTQAPAPSTLQQTGALISLGGTTAAQNSLTLLTQASSLATILAAPLTLSGLVWSGGSVTATAAVAHGLTVGQVYQLSIAGAVPTGYNGTYACTITSATAFTYPVATNPGTETAAGTYSSASVTELTQMVTTFFAQGAANSVYVLELGSNSTVGGIAALATWMTNNLNTVYAYLVPRAWDVVASFLTLAQSYQSPTAKTYFYVTTTNATYAQYGALNKCINALVESPTKTAGEFQQAAALWTLVNQQPSSTNKVPPFSFSFFYGVTPYPTTGMSATFAAWKAAGVNWVGTGAEGGISTAIYLWGTTMDGNPINYWYSIDWLQINIDLFFANAVINGSNNPINPLYLNQAGINTLEAGGAGVLASGVTFGLVLGTVIQTELSGPAFTAALDAGAYLGQAVINAVPFTVYYTANPSQYATGTYGGFSIVYTPLRGFEAILFNINATTFVA